MSNFMSPSYRGTGQAGELHWGGAGSCLWVKQRLDNLLKQKNEFLLLFEIWEELFNQAVYRINHYIWVKYSLLMMIIQIINPVEFYELILCFCRDYNRLDVFYTEDVCVFKLNHNFMVFYISANI